MASTVLPNTSSLEFEQRKDKAGLLVTEELEKAIERCKTKVETIAKECRRRNKRFRDVEFDLLGDRYRCTNELGASTLNPKDVLRVSQIFPNASFFVDGAAATDITQGALSDCWFISALVTVSTKPGLIEKICVARDEKVGIYGFIFFRDAGWTEVIIDDCLFTSIPKFEELNVKDKILYHRNKDIYNEIARKGSKSLYFASSGTSNETWVPLLEKAYAKLHGDYGTLSGGFENEAVEDLTGGVSNHMRITDILDEDVFWNEELLQANKDRLFGCSIDALNLDDAYPEDPDRDVRIEGLITNHAYSIISAVEVKGKRFVKIRNPWGEDEWTGRWSDGSKEWTEEWLQALPALQHSFGNDGQFIMEYKDFLSTWTKISKTRLFNSSWMLSSHWLEVTSRPYPCAWSFGDISFTISVPQSTPAVIVLAQLDERHFREISSPYYWSLDFLIYRKGDKEPLSNSVHDNFWRRSVNLEIDLQAGEYVVHVRLDRIEKPERSKEGWDSRKLARKLTEKCISASIASNFSPAKYGNKLPLKLDSFVGQDLSEIEVVSSAISNEMMRVQDNEKEEAPTEAPKIQSVSEDNREDLSVPAEGSPQTTEVTDNPPGPVESTDNDSLPEPASDPPPSIHKAYRCNGCKVKPIVGPRYRCLDSSSECIDFDLCQKCMNDNKHPTDHRMLLINTPEDGEKLKDKNGEENDNNVILGLRVYTQRHSSVVIKGQLRGQERR